MANDNPQKNQPVNLRGRYSCTLDAKKRLRIPSQFAGAFPPETFKTLVVFKPKDNCLTLYTTAEWEDMNNDAANRPPSAERREIMRYMSLASRFLTVDGHWRVLIPPEFLAMIDNAKDVVVVGVGGHMEVWNAENFDEMFHHAEDVFRKSDFER
jgi:MraZ protein